LKIKIATQLREAGFEIHDFGNDHIEPTDDYPDYVVPLAKGVAVGDVWRE
jgi:ribose 5-phosphate isomerase B